MDFLNRRMWPSALVVMVVFMMQTCKPGHSENRLKSGDPNIIILLADDLGYGDIQCYGSEARSPHLDELASDGIRFSNFYAAAPNCSPSRAGLLTGKVPGRTGVYSYRPTGSVMHLPDQEVTIAELLKDKGYQTAHFGKWHLGCLPQDSALNHPQPNDQGFEYSFGTENNSLPSHLNPQNFVRNGEELGALEGYSCQLIAREIVNWFDNIYRDDSPFFLYVAFNEVHKKIASPPALTSHYPNHKTDVAEYLANVESLDSAAGVILGKLDTMELTNNTIVLFSSDNGPLNTYQRANGGLRGWKSWLYEGGIRVPGIIRWPGVIQAGQVTDTPAGFTDILPTIAEICDVELDPDNNPDGTSILPLLRGVEFDRGKPMFWFFYRTYPEVALRMGDYVILGKSDDTVRRTHFISTVDMDFIKEIELVDFELYNLRDDPAQELDLSVQEPQMLERMKATMIKQLRSVTEEGPYWSGLASYDPAKARYQKPF